jgi:predicted nucleic acid-binding Zn finger protein
MKNKAAETETLKRVCGEAKANNKITGTHLTQLFSLFGPRFTKAWKALKDERVKKYVFKPSGRVVWIVVGRERDYLIMPSAEFCSCDDFYFHVMDRQAHLCYHLIAQKMAEALKWYDKLEERDGLYNSLMKEWMKATP